MNNSERNIYGGQILKRNLTPSELLKGHVINIGEVLSGDLPILLGQLQHPSVDNEPLIFTNIVTQKDRNRMTQWYNNQLALAGKIIYKQIADLQSALQNLVEEIQDNSESSNILMFRDEDQRNDIIASLNDCRRLIDDNKDQRDSIAKQINDYLESCICSHKESPDDQTTEVASQQLENLIDDIKNQIMDMFIATADALKMAIEESEFLEGSTIQSFTVIE